jgi:murein DD-endopeptidase MepM/ murein hydrolase activator NlpD
MYRALVVLGLALPALPAHARSQTGGPAPSQDLGTPTLMVARLANALDFQLVPQGLVDHLVRWRMSVRELAHRVADRLSTFANDAGLAIPDMTVLTWEPLAQSSDSWATSGFGWRDDPYRHYRKFHSGADIRAKPGTPIMAAGDGVVVFAGRQGGYGNVVYVDHGGGVITRYGHMRRIETKKDAVITAGTRIGQVGSTGRATGPHLHFEVRIDGHPVDPGTALTVAELQRESPAEGQLAAYALSPELQANVLSDLDPPKAKAKAKAKAKEARPDRPGRTKRVRPTS